MKKCIGACVVMAMGMAAMSYAQDDAQWWVPEKDDGIYAGARLGIYNVKVDGKANLTIGNYQWGETTKIKGNSLSGALAVGYKFLPYFRAEGEVSTFGGDVKDNDGNDDGSIDVTMFKALGYFDIPIPNSPVAPFVMLGLGYVNYKEDWSDMSYDGTAMSFDFGLGVGVSVTKNFTVDASWRYMTSKLSSETVMSGRDNFIAGPWGAAGAYNYSATYEPTLKASLFSVGARYIF